MALINSSGVMGGTSTVVGQSCVIRIGVGGVGCLALNFSKVIFECEATPTVVARELPHHGLAWQTSPRLRYSLFLLPPQIRERKFSLFIA